MLQCGSDCCNIAMSCDHRRRRVGQEAYDAINAASFTGVDCFLICFALRKGREASLSNVTAKWNKQLTEGITCNLCFFSPSVLIVAVFPSSMQFLYATGKAGFTLHQSSREAAG